MDGRVREDARARQKRITGQVEGIGRMSEDDRHCLDILSQITSIGFALEHLGILLLTAHMDAVLLRRDPSHASDKDPRKHHTEMQATLT